MNATSNCVFVVMYSSVRAIQYIPDAKTINPTTELHNKIIYNISGIDMFRDELRVVI